MAKISAAELQPRTPTAQQKELPIFHIQNIVAKSGEKGKIEGKKKGGRMKKRRRKMKIRGKKEDTEKRMERTK